MAIDSESIKLQKDIISLLRRGDRGKKCILYSQITVTDSAAVTLLPPTNAFSALIGIEADATVADSTKVVRYICDGQVPTASLGKILGNLDEYEELLVENIQNFKVIGIEAGKSHKLNIHYYSQI